MVVKDKISVKFIKYLFIFSLTVAFLIEGFWLIGIPTHFIEEKLKMIFMDKGITPEMSGLKKGLFYNIHIGFMKINKDAFKIELNDISLTLLPLYLFRGEIVFRMKASTAGGIVNGLLTKNKTVFDGKGLNIRDIENPILKGKGFFDFYSEIDEESGFMRFTLSEAFLESMNIGGNYIPLNLINRINGIFTFKNKGIKIESLSLYGKEVYGRIKGFIRDNSYEISIELMPEKDSLTLLNLLIPEHRVSPGYFRIDIKK